jgi:single-strand DNA-binding protein
MASINSVTIAGRLGKDPETRFTYTGKTIASFSIALDGGGRDADPIWIDVEAWDAAARTVTDYVRKGHMVGIVGRFRCDRWEDKTTGQKRSKLIVVANRVELLTSKEEAEAMAGGPVPMSQAGLSRATATAAAAGRFQPSQEEEIPF